MKKLLYITDQQEYRDNGAIVAIFNNYLKKYLDVNVVYFTKFKNSFQVKDGNFIVPQKYKKDICKYLDSKDVNLSSYDYIFVRNMYDLLKQVLLYKNRYNYKVGFRVSTPQTTQVYEVSKLQKNDNFLSKLKHSFGNYRCRSLINRCDIFLPNSNTMKKIFYPHVNIKVLPLRPGLDPNRIQTFVHTSEEDVTFIYVGTIDVINCFEGILAAFSKLKAKNWYLCISTQNPEFIRELLLDFPDISKRITIQSAIDLNELMEQIHSCDIGIALFPKLPIHQSTIPAKVVEYYTCSVPALINDNEKNRSVFDDGKNAFLTEFEVDKIAKKLEELMKLSINDISKIGKAGQKKLLGLDRNYETMAKVLYETLEEL